jgi:hypothetical protein
VRYVVILRASEEIGFPPPALIEGIGQLGAEAMKAGVLVDTAGLMPTVTATRVAVADGTLTVTDGPGDKPWLPVAAYAIYDVATREDVLEWTKRFMNLHREMWPGWAGESEIRQVFGPQGAPSA